MLRVVSAHGAEGGDRQAITTETLQHPVRHPWLADFAYERVWPLPCGLCVVIARRCCREVADNQDCVQVVTVGGELLSLVDYELGLLAPQLRDADVAVGVRLRDLQLRTHLGVRRQGFTVGSRWHVEDHDAVRRVSGAQKAPTQGAADYNMSPRYNINEARTSQTAKLAPKTLRRGSEVCRQEMNCQICETRTHTCLEDLLLPSVKPHTRTTSRLYEFTHLTHHTLRVRAP